MNIKADTTGLEYQSPEWFEACAAIKRGQLSGRTVQYQSKLRRKEWSPIDPAWHPGCDYRLAPEPRERWIAKYEDGTECVFYERPEFIHPMIEAYRVREVIE